MNGGVPLNPSRFLTAASVAAAILLVIGAIGLAYWQDEIHRDERARQTLSQADVLADSVTAALAFDDPTAAQEYVDALKESPDIEAAAVFEPGQKLLASFVRTGGARVPAAVFPGIDTRDSRVTVVTPARQAERTLGTVYLRTIRESRARRLATYLPIVLLGIMAAILVAVLANAQSNLGETNRRLVIEMKERARAEDALRQSQKMEAIGQLSGGIAHDFNNLLSIIQGSLQMVKRRLAQGRTDVANYADIAIDALNRAANLTRRLLAFARNQPLAPEPVELSDLVRNVMGLVENLVGATIRIETSLEAAWWTMCDANQMENVILNLAINARDAMAGGGTLTLATRDMTIRGGEVEGEGAPAGDYVELLVADTGTGMTRDVLERALDPFFTTKPVGMGTGLGLSVTFGYVRQSNGHMRIDSVPGKGTSVVILMPRTDAAPRSQSREAA